VITALLALIGCTAWDALIVVEALAEVRCASSGGNVGRLAVLALAVGLVSIVALHIVVINYNVQNVVAWSFGGAAGTLCGVYIDRRHHV